MKSGQRKLACPVELWLVDRQALADELSTLELACPSLSRDETERAAAMADQQAAAIWRAGRTALRLLLERLCGACIRGRPFAMDRSGRPSLVEPGCDFALSDTGAYLLMAFSSVGRIGVDIELPRPFRMPPERIARLEAAAEALGSGNASPLQSWTRIEAFAKAAGPSLAAVLSQLGIQGNRDGRLEPAAVRERSAAARAASGFNVHDLSLPARLVGAIALPPNVPAVPVRVLDHGTIASLVT